MLEQFTVALTITIRSCRQTDLSDLEWFGSLTEYRQIITDTFRRYQRSEVLMLVAEANDFPIGQVWVDLVKRREDAVGVVWALRMLRPFQNMGIGTRLIRSAEKSLEDRGFRTCEIAVEKDNPNAKRLYERLGYHVVRDNIEKWDYTTPSGKTVHAISDEWIMHKSLIDGATA